MKNTKFNNIKITFFLGLLFMATISCERGLSDEFEIATYPTTPEIFIDGFVGGLDYFPFGNSFAEAWSVDEDVRYKGTASMRFDIPVFGAGYGGATFPSIGPRDLSGYDALTFWAKASQGADINEIGFGINGETNNKYQVTLQNLPLSTNWTKYVIPIPDPSKLTQEKGMFWYAEGAENENDDGGYTFWIDELKFEKLGTIGQPRPVILGGQDQTAQANVDASVPLIGLTQTFNLANGQDVTVLTSPSYFDFVTSNPFVASVNDLGVVTVDGPGEIDPDTGLIDNTAVITATLDGVEASGSLTIEAVNIDVISIFSDLFANVPVDNYNGFYIDGFQTTLGGFVEEEGNNIIDYTLLNFVAIEFYGRDGSDVQPINATEMTHLHIDVRANETVDASDYINISLHNNFTQSTEVSGTFAISGTDLTSNEWVQFDIPLSSFSGLTSRDAVGMMLLVSDGTIANVSLDNIFFYSEN